MRSPVSLRSLVPILFVLVIAAPLAAQTTTGSLQGKVADTSGAVLPGATVELSSQAQIGGVQTTTTDRNGDFRFQRLSPGTYSMKVTMDGFKTIVRDGLRVEVGRTFDVDFRLDVGSINETVTVSAESPLV